MLLCDRGFAEALAVHWQHFVRLQQTNSAYLQGTESSQEWQRESRKTAQGARESLKPCEEREGSPGSRPTKEATIKLHVVYVSN